MSKKIKIKKVSKKIEKEKLLAKVYNQNKNSPKKKRSRLRKKSPKRQRKVFKEDGYECSSDGRCENAREHRNKKHRDKKAKCRKC